MLAFRCDKPLLLSTTDLEVPAAETITQRLGLAVFDALNTRQLGKVRDLVTDDFVEATGRPFAMKTAHFYRSRDGRLCEHWGVRDELDVLYQVGALRPPEFGAAGGVVR